MKSPDPVMQMITEKLSDVDVVSVELFEKVNRESLLRIVGVAEAKKINIAQALNS